MVVGDGEGVLSAQRLIRHLARLEAAGAKSCASIFTFTYGELEPLPFGGDGDELYMFIRVHLLFRVEMLIIGCGIVLAQTPCNAPRP